LSDTFKIGVIADTHTPEFLPELPEGIFQAFQDVDIILHAGDITTESTLDALKAIAPVIAIRGDHDRLNLPVKTVVELGGKRIGLFHGRRPRWQELPSILFNEVTAGHLFWWGGLQRYTLKLFPHVDVIVFGHFHRAYIARHNDVLLFNPGGIYQITPQRLRERLAHSSSLMERAYLLNAFRRTPFSPTVGMLTIEHGTIRADIVHIPVK
jgi:putative phosphoesterase